MGSILPDIRARASAGLRAARPLDGHASEYMVGDTGIEPVTPSMSTKCSTAELITHLYERVARAPNKEGALKHRAVRLL